MANSSHVSKPLRAEVLLALLLTAILGTSKFAFVLAIEPPFLMRESHGPSDAPGSQGCPLTSSLTGDCANLRYYNICSGYIWVYTFLDAGEGVGVWFNEPCVTGGNSVEKTITYFRNVWPAYHQTMDIYLDVDTDSDGCGEYVLTTWLDLDPALRWNCTDFGNICIPGDATGIIVRTQSDGGSSPTVVTDNDRSDACGAEPLPRSFYYGFGGSVCKAWKELSPTDRDDNFLYWLVVDAGCTTPTASSSWGRIKGLYR